VLEALDILNEGAVDPGISCDVVITSETFDDFDLSRRKSWSERGSRSEKNVAGLPALYFEKLQTFRGATRKSFIVVDAGHIRIVLQ